MPSAERLEFFLRKEGRGFVFLPPYCPGTCGHQPPLVCTGDLLPFCHCERGYTCCHSSPRVLPRTSVTRHADAWSGGAVRPFGGVKLYVTYLNQWILPPGLIFPSSLCFINYFTYGFTCPLHRKHAVDSAPCFFF